MALNYGQVFASQTTLTIPNSTHALGQANLRIQVYDAATPRRRLRPGQLVVNPSTFTITAQFLQAQSGLLVANGAASTVVGQANTSYAFASSTTWTVLGTQHGFGTDRLLVDAYDGSTPRLWLPDADVSVHPTTFDVVVTWLQPQAGTLVLCAYADVGVANSATALSAQTSTIILGSTHGRGTHQLGVQVYDASGVEVLPGSVTVHPTTFDVTVQFLQPHTGPVVLQGSRAQVAVPADVASATLTGTATPLRLSLPAASGALSSPGTATPLRLTLPVTSTALTLTGTSVAVPLVLPATPLALSLTAPPLVPRLTVSVVAGSQALAGTDVTLRYGTTTRLTATVGASTLAGTGITLLAVLPAAPSARTLIGAAVTLTRMRTLPADPAAATLAGVAAPLRVLLPAAPLTTPLAGTAVVLLYGSARTLPADPATSPLTGTAATLRHTARLPGDPGARLLAGTDTPLRTTVPLPGGTVTLTGTSAILQHQRLLVGAPALGLTLTGTATPLRVTLALTPQASTLTGLNAALLYGTQRVLVADPRSLALAGTAPILRHVARLAADPATPSLTGTLTPLRLLLPVSSATLPVVGTDTPLTLRLPVSSGSGATTGTAVLLLRGARLSATPGTPLLTGTAATLRHTARLAATPLPMPCPGTGAALGLTLAGAASALTLPGSAITLRLNLSATPMVLPVSGTDAVLLYGRQNTLTANPHSLILAGTTATLRSTHALAATPSVTLMAGPTTALRVILLGASSPTSLSALDGGLRQGKRLPATAAVSLLSGPEVALRYGARQVVLLEPGVSVLAGTDALLARHLRLEAQPGSRVLSGIATSLHVSLGAAPRLTTLAGTAAQLRYGAANRFLVEDGMLLLLGTPSGLVVRSVLAAGSFVLAGGPVTFVYMPTVTQAGAGTLRRSSTATGTLRRSSPEPLTGSLR
jgi:hypothetical protein